MAAPKRPRPDGRLLFPTRRWAFTLGYWYADVYDAFARGDDRGTIALAHKVNMPGHFGAPMMIAAACGWLGEHEAAGRALREFLAHRPDLAAIVRQHAQKWWAPEYVERLIDGLRSPPFPIRSPARGCSSAGGPRTLWSRARTRSPSSRTT